MSSTLQNTKLSSRMLLVKRRKHQFTYKILLRSFSKIAKKSPIKCNNTQSKSIYNNNNKRSRLRFLYPPIGGQVLKQLERRCLWKKKNNIQRKSQKRRVNTYYIAYNNSNFLRQKIPLALLQMQTWLLVQILTIAQLTIHL